LISDYEIGYIKQLAPVELHPCLLRCLKDDELCKMHGIARHGRKSGARTRVQLVREELTPFQPEQVSHMLERPVDTPPRRLSAENKTKRTPTQMKKLRREYASLWRALKKLRTQRPKVMPLRGRRPSVGSKWSRRHLVTNLAEQIKRACACQFCTQAATTTHCVSRENAEVAVLR
jgi:hypothetical protein